MVRRLLLCLFTLLLAIGQLAAQSATATISGTVTDSSGATVPRAQVKATNISTNVARSTTSAEDGSFSLTFLPLGTYRVEVSAPSFKKFEQTGVVLEIDRNARVNPVLQVGALAETDEGRFVQVNGDHITPLSDAQVRRAVGAAQHSLSHAPRRAPRRGARRESRRAVRGGT